MKILFVATVYRHLTAFHIPHMRYFQNQGHEVWAASNQGSYDRELLEKENIKCVDISFSRSPKSLDNIKAIKQLKSLLKEENFDYIDVHTPIAAFITRYAAKDLEKNKVVYTAHGFHFYKGAPLINWLLYYTAEKIAAPWTHHLITINNEDYKITKRLNYTPERVSLIHGVGVEKEVYNIDNNKLNALRKEFKIKENHVVISYVAELNDNKNHIFLLSNWNEIKKAVPNAKLLIIGYGSNEAILKKFVHDNKLDDITFTGYRRDVLDILKITHIVSLLSKREGLPKSIMEAMSNGLPCIVSNTRGLRDLVSNSKTGYIIDLYDSERLLSAFISLISDPNLRKKYGDQAKKDIQLYLLDNVIEEYANIYKQILKR